LLLLPRLLRLHAFTEITYLFLNFVNLACKKLNHTESKVSQLVKNSRTEAAYFSSLVLIRWGLLETAQCHALRKQTFIWNINGIELSANARSWVEYKGETNAAWL
jgi:hypothetical protein